MTYVRSIVVKYLLVLNKHLCKPVWEVNGVGLELGIVIELLSYRVLKKQIVILAEELLESKAQLEVFYRSGN